MYEVKGRNAKTELDILVRALEVIESEADIAGKSPEFIGSAAFRNVIKNLLAIQNGVSYSLATDCKGTFRFVFF